MNETTRRRLPAALLLAAAAALAALLAAHPLAGTAVLPGGLVVQGWLAAPVRLLYPAILAAALAGSAALFRFAGRRLGGSRLAGFRHLAWLPALLVGMHAAPLVGRTFAGIVLPLGGTLVAALCLDELLRPPAGTGGAPTRRRGGRADAFVFFAAAFVLLFLFWEGSVADRRFRGGGDVQHYRIQVENLLERGDLDLTDRMDAMMDGAGLPKDSPARAQYLRKSHMKVNRDGRVHSYHSFGFPLLAWPMELLFGKIGDTLLKALLGALALAGVRAACSAHGASRTAANVCAALTGLSYVWVFTALSFLPEMLGFGLCAWGFWAIAAQEDPRRRLAATLVSLLVCAYLPVAHVRFAPTAAALAGFFGLEGLLVRDEPFWRRKVPRLALYSLAIFAGWYALVLSHSSFFSGTAAYDYSRIAGRDPLTMWGMFSDRRGIVAVFPAIGACLAAAVCTVARGGAPARRAAMALATTAGVVYCCCSIHVALAGTCLNGRYFFPVLPVLLPFLAMAMDRADRGGLVWLLFLALLPVTYFLFVSPGMAGSSLLRAPAPLRMVPNMQSFWEPFPSFYASGTPRVHAVGSLFAASLLAVSFLACLRGRPRLRAALAAALLVLAFRAGRFVDRHDPPDRTDGFAVFLGDRHFHHFHNLAEPPADFFAPFRPPAADTPVRPALLFSDGPVADPRAYVRALSPAAVEPNDWAGRDLRWTTVRSTRATLWGRRGEIAFRARGRVLRGTALLAPVILGAGAQGEKRLEEGPFDVIFRVRTYANNGGANLLLALEGGVGEAIVDEYDIAPCPDALLEALAPFPAGAEIVDCRPPRRR